MGFWGDVFENFKRNEIERNSLYDVISADGTNISGFRQAVSTKIKEGWVPAGGIQVLNDPDQELGQPQKYIIVQAIYRTTSNR